jgi:hypothetical protein
MAERPHPASANPKEKTLNAVSTEVIPYQQMERMAQAIAKSGLFGVKNPDQALALMLVAQAEGVHPATAARDYHIIQGRPALKADAMLARFQAAGGKVQWKEHTDQRVSGVFSHPSGGSMEFDWTIGRARVAGLTGKEQWKSYPRQMLRARVISEGVRAVYPGVAVGIYTAEEVQDMDPKEVTGLSDRKIDEALSHTGGATPLTEGERADHLAAIEAAADGEALRAAYSTACLHANSAKDGASKAAFVAKYNARKEIVCKP